MCLSVRLPVCVCVRVGLCLFVCLYACMYVCLSVCLSVSACLCVAEEGAKLVGVGGRVHGPAAKEREKNQGEKCRRPFIGENPLTTTIQLVGYP